MPTTINRKPLMIKDIEQLDDLLSEPSDGVIESLFRLDGDIIVLGVAGKMGPTLARMAKRAFDAAGVRRRVIGVARFSDGSDFALQQLGIETIRCDLLDETDLARLPDAANVMFMAGRKFGSTGNESATWATNTFLPGMVCRRYPQSRIVAFSTGNVYGMTAVTSGGSREDDQLSPVGEYAMSCLGRERMFEYFSRQSGTKTAVLRLNYACELRYGVLVDLARQVWDGKPIDLGMGHFNVIWQGDANAAALQSFEYCSSPPLFLNLTGPELLSVRSVCEQMSDLMNRPVRFIGTEAETALLSDPANALKLFGQPKTKAERLIEWISKWVAEGGSSLGKPTHFEMRDGRF